MASFPRRSSDIRTHTAELAVGGEEAAAELGAGGPPTRSLGGAASTSSAKTPAFPRGTPSIAPEFRGVKGFVDSYVAVGQTHPPSIPVSKLFSSGFPVGEIQTHPGESNTFRETSEERRHLERLNSDLYDSVREAAEVHRHVRKFAQGLIRPGIRLSDFCAALEDKNRELVGEAGLARGIAFPTGCSLNHVAAHYTPNPGVHY